MTAFKIAPETKPAAALPRLWFWNVLLAAILHLRFIDRVEPAGTKAAVFLYLGLVTNAFILSLIPALTTVPIALTPRRFKRFRRAALATIWTLYLSAIWLDANIWGLFHYHFNGMVWATMTNPGAADAIHIGTTEIVFNIAAFVGLFAAQYLAIKWLETRSTRGFKLSNRIAFLAILLPLTLVEKGIYAHSDLIRDRRVTAIAGAFPMYQRLTIKRMMRKHFDYDLSARPELDLPGGHFLLDYPREAPTFPKSQAKRPNIALIVIDSLRADAFNKETMPQLFDYAAERGGRVFDNHLSGGNATRFGVFSLLYGLHGNYWIPILTEEASPVLVDSLIDLDYDFGIYSTASMDYPEFRSTAWVKIPDSVHDRVEGENPAQSDSNHPKVIAQWLDQKPKDKPFFLFSLLDSPHQVYSFPEENAPFQPFAEHIKYTGLASGADPETELRLRNAYKNAVHHTDGIVAEILADFEARGELDNTIVIITGDHGEEFFENGFFGHTSNFTDAQVHVPFIMLGPGIEAGHESLPTSHLDVVPTLLEMLGADPELRGEYSLGDNLLEPSGPGRRRIVSGWDLLGLRAPGGILVVPTATHRGLVEGKTNGWETIYEDGDLIKSEGAALARLAMESGRFLR